MERYKAFDGNEPKYLIEKIVKGPNHGSKGKTQDEQGQTEGRGEGGREFQGVELMAERKNTESKSSL